MSIVRLICVDPRPRQGESDLRVYQVPDKSREKELLEELFSQAGIEHAVMDIPRKSRKVKGHET
jgi:hypothetical protein